MIIAHIFLSENKKNADYKIIMIRTKILVAAFLGTFVYASLSFFFGRNGIVSYGHLQKQKIEISRQTDIIQNLNNELNLEYTALLKDKDVISSYARKLDYVGEGEKLVKIKGLKPMQTKLYDTGTVLKRKMFSYLPESVCKIISFLVFSLSFLIMLLIDLSKGNITFRNKKTDFVKGIPIYDLPQI